MEESVLDTQLEYRSVPRRARERTVRTVTGLTTGLKVSEKSARGRCVKPRSTQRALYRSREPSALNLCLNIHLPETTLAWDGQRTRSQVVLCTNTENSSSIAALQLGSARTARYVLGTGDNGAAWYRARTRKPCLAPVVIVIEC
jgi:hypothetical protein